MRKVHFTFDHEYSRTACGMRRQALMGGGGATDTVNAEEAKLNPVTCKRCLRKLNIYTTHLRSLRQRCRVMAPNLPEEELLKMSAKEIKEFIHCQEQGDATRSLDHHWREDLMP